MKGLLTAILILHCSLSVAAESVSIATPRGSTIEVIADFPIGAGPFTTVILAPGQGYHMRLAALEQTARRLVEEDIAVYRFDWTYYTATPRGSPSQDFVLEIEDMNTVVALAVADSRVDSSRVWAAGKSLGSSVAWHVLRANRTLRGGVLLTPVCSQVESAGAAPVAIHDYYYPDVSAETRPLVFAQGDADPLCSTPILYGLMADLSAPTRLLVVGGDHSFEGLPRAEGNALDENLQAVADFVALAVADFSAD